MGSVANGDGDPAISVDELPLVIDLDGTLIRTDLLVESCLALIKRNLLFAFAMPWWLADGKARLKREVASRVTVDVPTLPFSDELITYLRQQRNRGRMLVLATASHEIHAAAVANHLGLFAETIATNTSVNLSGSAKAGVLTARFGERGFDYAGNSRIDLRVWRHARRGILVDANAGVRRSAAKVTEVERSFDTPGPAMIDYVRALRLHQWLKNLLLFVPLFTAHSWTNWNATSQTALGFCAFCLCASGTYVINDLFDLEADRNHPRKRMRPFAAGRIPLRDGILVAAGLIAAGAIAATFVNSYFLATLLAYIGITLSYSLYLKTYVLIDTMTLASLYTLRIIAGGAAAPIELSFWLLAFSMFLFLSLAMVKRCSELNALSSLRRSAAKGRDYRVADFALVATMGAASGYIAVLVLALFLQTPEVVAHYARPRLLWFLCPIFLYWISRLWLKAGRGEMHDDPLVFTVYDRASRLLIIAAIAIVFGAT